MKIYDNHGKSIEYSLIVQKSDLFQTLVLMSLQFKLLLIAMNEMTYVLTVILISQSYFVIYFQLFWIFSPNLLLRLKLDSMSGVMDTISTTLLSNAGPGDDIWIGRSRVQDIGLTTTDY